MNKIQIDREKCIKCGTCQDICLASIIELEDLPGVSEENEIFCMKCGQCEAICEQSAVELIDPSIEGTINNKVDFKGNHEQIGNYMRSRRSVRNYKAKTVDKKIFEEIIDIARYAPSAGNGQPTKWMIVHDPTNVKKLAGLTIKWIKDMIGANPSDPNMTYMNSFVNAWENGRDPILRGAPHLVIAYAHHDKDSPMAQYVNTDVTIALAHFELALPSFGLGSCWAGLLSMAINGSPEIAKELGLSPENTYSGAMMVGYPQYEYHNIPKRNKASVSWK